MKPDREQARHDVALAAMHVRELLSSRAQPLWTTTVGPGIAPQIKIECADIELMNALDDFLKACVRAHRI